MRSILQYNTHRGTALSDGVGLVRVWIVHSQIPTVEFILFREAGVHREGAVLKIRRTNVPSKVWRAESP